jgi:hypothetical protein
MEDSSGILIVGAHYDSLIRTSGALQTITVPKALQALQQIKVGELSVNGKRITMATRITAEQKEILNRLGVKSIPAQFLTNIVVV